MFISKIFPKLFFVDSSSPHDADRPWCIPAEPSPAHFSINHHYCKNKCNLFENTQWGKVKQMKDNDRMWKACLWPVLRPETWSRLHRVNPPGWDFVSSIRSFYFGILHFLCMGWIYLLDQFNQLKAFWDFPHLAMSSRCCGRRYSVPGTMLKDSEPYRRSQIFKSSYLTQINRL